MDMSQLSFKASVMAVVLLLARIMHLIARIGGLVSARHNESRDLNIDLCSKAGLKTTCEPVIKDSIEGNDSEVLRVDWGVRGLWESQREALFDICICNADAPS